MKEIQEIAHFVGTFCTLKLVVLENFLIHIEYISTVPSDFIRSKSEQSDLMQEVIEQLSGYFAGKLKVFTVPVLQYGTRFQEKAWEFLQTIPYGETRSYEQEAIGIGSPRAVRAVGNANGKNNLPIIVPCHRVIAKSGKLGGYSGGLQYKEKLLALEGITL